MPVCASSGLIDKQSLIDRNSQQWLTVVASTPIAEVVQRMNQTQASCTLVLEQQQLLGIFTERDVVRAMATGQFPHATLTQCMTHPVITLSETEAEDLTIVLQRFRQHQICHLPVVNRQHQVVGMVTPVSVRYALQQEVAQRQQLMELLSAREAQYQAAEARLRAILNSAIATSIVSIRVFRDRSWLCDYQSPGCEALFGYTAEEILSDQGLWLSRLHPEDVVTVLQPLLAEIFAERTATIEYRFYHKDGSLRWISATYTSCQDAVNHCWVVTGVSQDISDRKRSELEQQQAEERLKQAELQYRTLIEQIPGVVYTSPIQATTKFAYISPQIQQMLNLPSQEWNAGFFNSWSDYVHPDDRSRVLASVHTTIATGVPLQAEYRMITRDGRLLWVRDQAHRVLAVDGQTQVLQGLAFDITDRKEIEAALQHSEARYRAIVEDQTELISRFLPDSTILFVNQAYCRFFGIERDAIMGQSFQPVIYEEDRERVLQLVQSMTPANPTVTIENRVVVNGEIRWTQWNNRMLFNQQGQFVEFQSVGRDITERKQAEERLQRLNARLQESNQELQNFAFVASHDLKEPLRTIRNFVDLLVRRCAAKLDQRERDFLDRIQAAAKRMQAQIEDLLSLSRVTTQAQPFVPVDLNRVVQTVLAHLEVKLRETNATVEVGELLAIEADPGQMHQLLQNLISNALKFHGLQPPVVRITGRMVPDVAKSATNYQIWVEDNGIGFEEKHCDRIFQIFERLHGRDDYEGTGIGLAICRKIAERHGGTIAARSTPGQGSRFSVTLPTHHQNSPEVS